MKTCLLAFTLFAASLYGQQTNVVIQPDISFNFGPLTAAGTVQFLQSTQTFGIRYWRFTYQSTGFSVVSIQLESAPDSAGAPGTWVVMPGSVTAGANPQTALAGGLTSIVVSSTSNNPWVRINLATATGTGSISGRVMGYRVNPDGGTGCASPCIVIGPDAHGVAPTQNPVQTAGLDGSGNVVPIILCTLSAVVNVSSMGENQIIALSSGKTIRVCNLDVSFPTPSAFTVQLDYGTGSNCGTGTGHLGGIFTFNTAVLGLFDDPGAYAPYVPPASNAVCLNLSAAVTVQGTVHYAIPY